MTDLVDAAEETSDSNGEWEPLIDAGADLLSFGASVVPALDEVAREHWNDRLFEAMDDFPEYRVRGRSVQRVLGGFGALGNPSSFHHPDVRLFRRMRKKLTFRPVLASFARLAFPAEHREVKLESLFDRLCVRCEAFNRPVAEAWHRDIYGADKYGLRPLPSTLPGGGKDLLFGGWTNLDSRVQKFVCLLGTHSERADGASGFSEFSKEEIASLRFHERLAEQSGSTYGHTLRTDERGHVVVPPGHSLLFQQQLVHSVVSGAQPDTPALRVFHGLRLTCETTPLFDIARCINHGGVPRLPSGQIPPMFSSNHYQFFASHEGYRSWGERTFRAQCLFARSTKAGVAYSTPGSAGDLDRAANRGRYMPSLSEMGLWEDRFRYSEPEARAMHPQPLFA